jgi:hypothetical protein
VTERAVLEQRLATLNGLLEGPGQLLGTAGADLASRLREGWQAERRLLERLLAEAPGAEMRPTVGLWRARTAGFVERTSEPQPGWTDRQGQWWDARQVLALLDDVEDRLDAWLQADELADLEAEG